jgi:hypothetical protein
VAKAGFLPFSAEELQSEAIAAIAHFRRGEVEIILVNGSHQSLGLEFRWTKISQSIANLYQP